MNLKLNINVK